LALQFDFESQAKLSKNLQKPVPDAPTFTKGITLVKRDIVIHVLPSSMLKMHTVKKY
jgi:hypothetical protein